MSRYTVACRFREEVLSDVDQCSEKFSTSVQKLEFIEPINLCMLPEHIEYCLE